MFFSIFGWIVCLIICCYLVVVCFLMALNNLGKYNIGGGPNKVFTLIFYCFVIFCWYLLFHFSPFSRNIAV